MMHWQRDSEIGRVLLIQRDWLFYLWGLMIRIEFIMLERISRQKTLGEQFSFIGVGTTISLMTIMKVLHSISAA